MTLHRLLLLTIILASAGVCLSADGAPSRGLSCGPETSKVKESPLQFEADQIIGQRKGQTLATGNVVARSADQTFRADWMRYSSETDELEAKGHVEYQRCDDRLESKQLHMKVKAQQGVAEPAHFFVSGNNGLTGRAEADKLYFEGPDKYRLTSASFTTCPANDNDWYLRSSQLDLNYDTDIGTARNVRIEYLGIPILYAPSLDFSLNEKRKSGFLSPSFGASDKRGLDISAPWYWNIAPNQDATITPRLMTKRGLQLGIEYRYLEPTYRGEIEVEALPHDRQTGTGRYREYIDHKQQIAPNLYGTLHFEDVSDDTYFTDLSSLVDQTALQYLPREATLNYDGGWWNILGRIQNYQTLQDPSSPVTPPYRREPQILVNADRYKLFGSPIHFNFSGELVRFGIDDPTMATGARLNLYPSLDLNLERPYGYIRPKLGWEYTRYALDRNPYHSDTLNPSRSLPIVSVDSGLYLDRQMSWHGSDYMQTLEPRLYYVWIPYRNQTALPIFDSSAGDPLQPLLYNENQFIGVDRVNDANQLTIGVTTRFVEAKTGLERLQITLGQRLYFKSQQVTMPGYAPRGANITNLLGQVSGQLTNHWRLDSGFQYDSHDGQLAQASIGSVYRAGPGKLVNADLRYTNALYGTELKQADLSWEWPIKTRWYGLGRINYSFYDHRLVEGLIGFEYNAGCWSVRGVMQKLVTTSQTTSTNFYLQLELHGLTRLGPNPLDVLRNSIPGYTKSDELQPN